MHSNLQCATEHSNQWCFPQIIPFLAHCEAQQCSTSKLFGFSMWANSSIFHSKIRRVFDTLNDHLLFVSFILCKKSSLQAITRQAWASIFRWLTIVDNMIWIPILTNQFIYRKFSDLLSPLFNGSVSRMGFIRPSNRWHWKCGRDLNWDWLWWLCCIYIADGYYVSLHRLMANNMLFSVKHFYHNHLCNTIVARTRALFCTRNCYAK